MLLAFLDVDLEASLETCVRYIWPNLVETGYVFIDEFVGLDYCALFLLGTLLEDVFQQDAPRAYRCWNRSAVGRVLPWAVVERETRTRFGMRTRAHTRGKTFPDTGLTPQRRVPKQGLRRPPSRSRRALGVRYNEEVGQFANRNVPLDCRGRLPSVRGPS